MSGWSQFSRDEDTEKQTSSSFDLGDDGTEADDFTQSTLTSADPEPEVDAVEADAETEGKKTKPATAKKRATGAITRANVQRVLDLRDEITEADDDLIQLLAFITKAGATTNELTIALLTQAAGGDTVLTEISQLLEAADDNPFRLSAQLTGMDRSDRNRVHGVLMEVSGNTETMPRDDINAAVMLAGMISNLTDAQRALIASALSIKGS